MKLGAKGLALIKEFEGYHKRLPDGSCQAYLDTLVRPALRSPGYKGLWTIGYGCTKGVTEGLVWTEKQATRALMAEIATHETALNAKMRKLGVSLDQNQYDALISASYNLGSGSKLITGVLDRLKKGDESGAAALFLKYNKAGGVVRKGLVRRRAAEAKLFKMYVAKDIIATSKKLTWLQRFRIWLSSLGLGAYLTWENVEQARQFMTDNMGLIVLGVGATAWLVTKWVESRTVQDYEEGRYVPSGYEE